MTGFRGIIIGCDILFPVAAKGLSNTVGEMVSTMIFSCRQEDSITTALNLMGARNLRRPPALDLNGRTVDPMTPSDLSRRVPLDSGIVQRAIAAMSGASG